MVKCRKCGHEIGKTLDINGLEMVQLAGVVCREVKGRCVHCGEPFYYSVSEKQIDKLINKSSNYERRNKAERRKIIFNLRENNGMKWKEIAQIVKISEVTCRRDYKLIKSDQKSEQK
jgi:transcription initiation factor TFIIIB Brf1 subunit/transcription initiation factor TFIIB